MKPQWRWLACGFIDLVSLAGMYASTAALFTVVHMRLDAGDTHLLPKR